MRAVVYERYGGPGVLRLAEVPIPEPSLRQVLVEVVATSVNLSDWEALPRFACVSAGVRAQGAPSNDSRVGHRRTGGGGWSGCHPIRARRSGVRRQSGAEGRVRRVHGRARHGTGSQARRSDIRRGIDHSAGRGNRRSGDGGPRTRHAMARQRWRRWIGFVRDPIGQGGGRSRHCGGQTRRNCPTCSPSGRTR